MAARILPDRIEDYLTELVPRRADELRKMEQVAARTDFPIIGPTCGHACYLLARMIGARTVFELGSGYGYSTAWFARAVHENGGGKVYHVVWDAELSARGAETPGHSWLRPVDGVSCRRGGRDLAVDAGAVRPDVPRHRQGGLPGGSAGDGRQAAPRGRADRRQCFATRTVADPGDRSPSTEAVRRFTRLIAEDPIWIATILPIRDGMLVAWKKS